MAKNRFPCTLYVLVASLIINLWIIAPIQAEDDQRKVYIVYMGNRDMPDIPEGDSSYLDMIKDVIGSDPLQHLKGPAECLLHTFKNFKGCVVHLTDKEAQKMSKMSGVVSVFPSRKKNLQTTRSWDFMGLPLDVKRSSGESDVIVGVIDTGIWPESDSFNDDGFGPPPAKWKGTCDTSLNFTCNNKLIGARYFKADGNVPEDNIASPRDSDGHGTHTASTAAGSAVDGASYLGLGLGTARGGAPSARIAVYKVCWSDVSCGDAELLAAFDAAISDGVDIISISIGGPALPYIEDSIAIGAFYAMKHGILTSSSAGNEGPGLHTLGNVAPWLLTVAASTIDRKFVTQVKLGNGAVFQVSTTRGGNQASWVGSSGISLNTFDLQNKTFPIIHGVDARNSSYYYTSRYCEKESLNSTLVEEKIVICDWMNTGETPFIAGAAGVIMQDLGPYDSPRSFPLPASFLKVDDGTRLLAYVRNLTSTPYGTILKSIAINDTTSPTVVSFSSRGPNTISPSILKPDLTAPGVAILAAYSPIAPVTKVIGDLRSVPYIMISGTSMACPHVSGVAAYVKSFHPTWSPSAIKSALMTTANQMRSESNEEVELAYGSGHVNPLKALNPGLVYDANEDDYIKFLCNEGLNAIEIGLISGEIKSCGNSSNDLNYPSMAVSTSAGGFDTVFYRTVTNVGTSNSTYRAVVTTPEEQAIAIKVQPSVLEFKSAGEKLSFRVRVSGSIGMRGLISASLVWDDGEHQIRSPIVVYNLS